MCAGLRGGVFFTFREDAGPKHSALLLLWWVARPLLLASVPPASSNLSPQLQLLSLLSASSTFTNFSIEETPQAGPGTVFLILLGASRPQPGEHPDSRSGWGVAVLASEQPPGRGAGRKCRLGGVGGQSRSRGSDQGSAALRAGGFQLPRDSRGLGTERPQVVPGPKCQ